MDFTEVKSSNIAAIAFSPYQGETIGDLFIRFLNGSAYRYANVPELIFSGFMEAESVGRYFFAVVRGIFGSERLDDWIEKRDDTIVDETVEAGELPEGIEAVDYGEEDELEPLFKSAEEENAENEGMPEKGREPS